jgi:hypothetical protein
MVTAHPTPPRARYSVPVWALSRSAFGRILAASDPRFPGEFSCNAGGLIFRKTRNGRIRANEREFVGDPFLHLVVIPTLLAIRPEGGRFVVDEEGVWLKSGPEMIIRLVVPPDPRSPSCN